MSLGTLISEIGKNRFCKNEFNSKLADLRRIVLKKQGNNENSEFNTMKQGFILDECKCRFESNFTFADEENENENLIRGKKNIKQLRLHQNLIQNNSFFDYLSKFFYGYQENIFNFPKIFGKTKKTPNMISFDPKENDFIFNYDGNLFGYVDSFGNIVISETEPNEFNIYQKYLIQLPQENEIISFQWDSINSNKFYYATNSELYECKLNKIESQYIIDKIYSLTASNFINCFPSPKGDLLILLYKNKIEVYDLFQTKLYSTRFNFYNFINGNYDTNATTFIAYTKKDLVIFNLNTFDFKTISYFPGVILKVMSMTDNIYVFVILEEKNELLDELLLYTITNFRISDCRFSSKFNSYQNEDDFYNHFGYMPIPQVYSFKNELFNNKIIDVNLSPNGHRLGILYQDLGDEKTYLYVFALIKDKQNNGNIVIKPLYNFGNSNGKDIVSFKFNSFINKGKVNIIVRLSQDDFIRTQKLEG